MQTIAAIATAPGRAGVGIVRVSGPQVSKIAEQLLGFVPQPRFAHYCRFQAPDGATIDQGIALYFVGPHSFTGEDVLELQGHGGPIVLDMLLEAILSAGARLARPGEFSERAFLNEKLDLAQAEAVADLINASSRQAAKQALNSLQGEFSREIQTLLDALINLRMYVESAIDFPEEEVDFLAQGQVTARVQELVQQVDRVLHQAQQGALLRDGMKVVILGQPNAGKSSLLNALAQRDIAIVTDIAGTTRDLLREQINIDGMPLHLIDTAGIRATNDPIELLGMERAWRAIDEADRILLMIDTTDPQQLDIPRTWPQLLPDHESKLTVVYNKTDLSAYQSPTHPFTALPLSIKTGAGLQDLREHLKKIMGLESTTEGVFSARRRHLLALQKTRENLLNGLQQLQLNAAGELLAEDLRVAQHYLSEITGEFTSDDLLGEIFGQFCIGK